jgi:hypothetical protein
MTRFKKTCQTQGFLLMVTGVGCFDLNRFHIGIDSFAHTADFSRALDYDTEKSLLSTLRQIISQPLFGAKPRILTTKTAPVHHRAEKNFCPR